MTARHDFIPYTLADESTTALHPNGVTVHGILSRSPAPAPSGGKAKTSAKAPFPLPGPDPWGGVLLTSAPLSCWHLLYKASTKCQPPFFYFSRIFFFGPFPDAVFPRRTVSFSMEKRPVFAHFAQAFRKRRRRGQAKCRFLRNGLTRDGEMLQ